MEEDSYICRADGQNLDHAFGRVAGSKGEQEGSWSWLLAAGINDWGGLSPLTRDFVNPEKPWPHLASLAAVTAKSGKALVPRSAPSHTCTTPQHRTLAVGELGVHVTLCLLLHLLWSMGTVVDSYSG
jgi:hypothetical protein